MKAILLIFKVLVTVRYLAEGSFFSECGDLHGISKSSVCRCVHNVTAAICEHIDNIIFSEQQHELIRTKREFYSIAQFPNVIGAINGTLVPIIATKTNEADFVCRKGFRAINVQAVVDTSLRFTNIVCKWPGSVHDAFILANSSLKDRLEVNADGWLLGDSGYPLKPYLMTPKVNPSKKAEENYNTSHSRTRVVVERAFGVCKSRFRCIHKTGGALPFAPNKCLQIITAVFKLHNRCIDHNLPIPATTDEETADNIFETDEEATVDGKNIRQKLIERFA